MNGDVLTLGGCIVRRNPSGLTEVLRADKYIHIASELLSQLPVEGGLLRIGDINTVYYRVQGAVLPHEAVNRSRSYVEALRVD